MASFIHDGRVAERAVDFGGHLVLLQFVGGGVEGQSAGPLVERHVLLVENGRPLKRRAVHDLASAAMTVLGVQRLFALQHIGDLPTLAMGAPLDRPALLGCLDLVRRPVFPGLGVQSMLRGIVGEGRGRQGIVFSDRTDVGHLE